MFECEAALKVFFGDAGRLEDLQSQLRTLASAIATTEPPPAETLRQLRDGPIRFPGRLQYTMVRATTTSWTSRGDTFVEAERTELLLRLAAAQSRHGV